jgi:hypothetical protein
MQLQEQRQFFILFRVVRVLNLLQQQLFHMSLIINYQVTFKKLIDDLDIMLQTHRYIKMRYFLELDSPPEFIPDLIRDRNDEL